MNKGFTLIELIVVLAIIGILIGVVVSSYSAAKNKGKSNPCKEYENYKIENVPVKCYEYFKINRVE